MSRWIRGAWVALAMLAGCAQPPAPLPPIEPWGDLRAPFADSIETAAALALGARADAEAVSWSAVRLAEFDVLGPHEREMRSSDARALVQISVNRHKFAGQDSLPPLLEALHIDPRCIEAYAEAARVLQDRGASERAHALALQGLRLDGNHLPLWVELARVYVARSDDARACVALERAIAIDSDAVPRATLAILRLRLGDVAAADSLAQLSGDVTLARYLEGVRARERGDLEAARDAFAAAAHDPGAQAAMLVDWGRAELDLGYTTAAIAAFETALERVPHEPAALIGLGSAQRASGDLEAAVATFRDVAARQPQLAIAQFDLAGSCQAAAERALRAAHAESLRTEAERAFGACIQAGFQTHESRLQRAHVRYRLGNTAGAADDAKALFGVPAHAAAARLLYGRAALARQLPQEAILALDPLARGGDASPDALFVLGRAFLETGRPANAVGVLRKAHAAVPGDLPTAINLGVALSLSGDLAAAESFLEKIRVAHPDDPDVLQNLAAVFSKRGRHDEAERLQARAMRLRDDRSAR